MRGIKATALLTAGRQIITDANGNRVQSACAGTYYPGHMKNGVFIPARWVGSLFLNDGNNRAGENGSIITLTVWNGHTSREGQGPADRFAKSVSVGQLMMADIRYTPWKRPFIDPRNNQAITRPDGSVVTVPVPAWTYIPGSRTFLHDAQKEIAAQIERGRQYTAAGQQVPAMDFWARPDTTTQQGQQLWQNIMAEREKLVFHPGMQYYGFAVVSVPQGVELTNSPPAGYNHNQARSQQSGGGQPTPPAYNPNQTPANTGTGSFYPAGRMEMPANQGFQAPQQAPNGGQAPQQSHSNGFVPPMPGGTPQPQQNQGYTSYQAPANGQTYNEL